jgi:tungstate transport system permease protein
MAYLWEQFRLAVGLLAHADHTVAQITWVTIKIALIATGSALAVGLPIALCLGTGRFRGRRALIVLADASLALPPVVVGVGVLVLTLPNGPLGHLRIEFTLIDVYAAQAILAMPFVVALATAAFQGLPEGLVAQARLLGAGRLEVWMLVLREAKVGVLAAAIAALGTALSEIGAVVIVGGNIEGYDQTLGSAVLQQVDQLANFSTAIALGIVLLVVILVLTGVLTALQQSRRGVRMRFRAS